MEIPHPAAHVGVAGEVEVLHQHRGAGGALGDVQRHGVAVDEHHVVLPRRAADVLSQHHLLVPRRFGWLDLLHAAVRE